MDLRKRLNDLRCRAAVRLDPLAPPIDAEDCQNGSYRSPLSNDHSGASVMP